MVIQKCYAKLNISLKVLNAEGGYHNLDSINVTVDKYDVISVNKRRDDKILVTFTGKYGFIPKFQEDTNVYKSAKAFIEKYKTTGANITVTRNVPTGSGMGSSSCDIAGTLLALKKLYDIKDDVKPIADSLGSDSGYLLTGGLVRATHRGEELKPIVSEQKYYFVVIYAKRGVNTKECFSLYDEKYSKESTIDIDEVEKAIINGDLSSIAKFGGNDLYLPAKELNLDIERNLNALKSLSPEVCFMTGSGSACFAIYKEYEMASWAYSKLKKQYKDMVDLLYLAPPTE